MWLLTNPKRRRGRDTAPVARRGTEVVDARNGAAHLVPEDALIAGRRAGCYVAICGASVLTASLTTPADKYCRACTEGAAL